MRRLARYTVALTTTASCFVTAGSVSHAFEPVDSTLVGLPAPHAVTEPVGSSGAGELLDAVSAIAADTAAEQRAILDYWTADRMRAATPAVRRLPRPKKFPILYDPALPPLRAGGADGPASADAPRTPDPGAADPGTPDPGTPDPGTAGPGPVDPAAPGVPEPGAPEPGAPEPGAPDAGTPEAGSTAPGDTQPRSDETGSLLPEGLLGGPGTETPAAPAAPPAPAPRGAPQGGGYPWNGGGAITRATGKVFFTLSGTDYVCTASTVRGGNRDTVLTAGHCVNDGPGEFASRWIFVPGYRDGARPYGTWTARRLLTPTPWSEKGDVDYDVGFALLNPVRGRHVTDVVGAQQIAFNSARGAHLHSFGYPSVGGYNGARLFFCRGTGRPDKYGSDDQGIPCDMTEGSSGGPWLSKFNTATGTGLLTSVNSFGYDDMPEVMFGPYFGERIRALFNTAQRS